MLSLGPQEQQNPRSPLRSLVSPTTRKEEKKSSITLIAHIRNQGFSAFRSFAPVMDRNISFPHLPEHSRFLTNVERITAGIFTFLRFFFNLVHESIHVAPPLGGIFGLYNYSW